MGGRARGTGRDGPRPAAASPAQRLVAQRARVVRGAVDARAGRPRPPRRGGRRDARQRRRPRPERRRPCRHPVRAHRHGRRHRSRQRASHRGARGAARRAHRQRRHRGVPRPPRRQRVRRAGAGRRRARVPRRELVAFGHARARAADRAPRPARPHRGVGPRGVRRQGAWRLEGQGARPRRARHRRRPVEARRPRARARPARAHAARADAGRQRPARPHRPQPGRGVGAHDPHRPAPRRRRLRRARPRALDAQGHPDRCGCSRRRRRPRSAPTSSPTCAGRRCSTTSSSPRPRSASWPRKRGRSSARVASGSRSTRPTCTPRPARWPSGPNTTQLTGADMLRLALGLEGSPLAGGITVEGGGWAADLLAAASDLSGEPATRPQGLRRRAAQLPGRGAGVARASSTPAASAAAWPSTWAWARRPPCSPTSSRRPTAVPRW